MSHTRTLLSLEPLTQKSPAGDKAAESTHDEWPVRRAAGDGEDRSWMAWSAEGQMLKALQEITHKSQMARAADVVLTIVPSSEALASSLPSAVKDKDRVGFPCASILLRVLPVDRSSKVTEPS